MEGIRDIFVPNEEDIQAALDGFLYEIEMKFGFDTEFFTKLFVDEAPVTDIYGDYEVPGVGNFNFKFFDASMLVKGIVYFRPFIRGFIVLMLAVFHIKHVLSFLRQDAGVMIGKSADIESGTKGGGKQ